MHKSSRVISSTTLTCSTRSCGGLLHLSSVRSGMNSRVGTTQFRGRFASLFLNWEVHVSVVGLDIPQPLQVNSRTVTGFYSVSFTIHNLVI
jgi:hypothetical protein